MKNSFSPVKKKKELHKALTMVSVRADTIPSTFYNTIFVTLVAKDCTNPQS
jgi:hypothetical protein